MVDAIDGAGKSTAISAITEYLSGKGLKVFDLVAYTKQEKKLPDINDPLIADSDVLLSAEPTFCWTGLAIREEIAKEYPEPRYDGFTAAQAFALDRLVLFKRVIIPYLQAKPNRWVIQDRGVISSLVYQPVQDERVTLDYLLSLEGNRFELTRPPDLLLLLRLHPTIAMQRIAGREEKKDGHIYETASFQERTAGRYQDPTVLAPYINAGTHIKEIDASKTPEEVMRATVAEIESLNKII